ncbi:2-oxoglutarate dehydrogenase, E2 component, dihydrolipoamide succinyltransferase [Micromonospora aurantiaca (nom. illeg.)]|uniref:2-oxoglutarate dehydrogenase, E2 component, dihydrolipoamide succinyltransferase n=1 Tax=Micromonospora aurantiaca (nom. illeg.) TaxID=47850 RepID=UPI0001BF4727|nr:2-oxoglutarate dehydrogenase, E2 component, dihydrolipoamide succinyltransferase [Micromonospora aurantiaca]ADL48115.1 2-oxoglutarate dehydrogenase, E2 component, dihydrolipoamide succinyltransferase [Micromonospora aurantiaca ATCC 27029]
MPVSVTMPRLGESVTEGTVTRWLKQEGDTVEVDEPLLEVSTDKVDTEIPSPAAGVLSRIVVGEDETAEVGSELAVIAGEGEDAGAAPTEKAEPATEPTAAAEGTGPEPEQAQEAEEAAAEPGAEAEQPAVEEPAEPAAPSGEGTPVTMPALGESVTEGTVTRWLKQVGETVEVDEPLLEVSTDKVDTEIPSPVAGTLQEIKVAEDETADVGAVLAIVGVAGAAPAKAEPKPEPKPEPKAEAKPEPKPEPKVEEPTPGASYNEPAAEAEQAAQPAKAEQAAQPAEQAAQPAAPAAAQRPSVPSEYGEDAAGYVTPLVRKLAAEHGVDLGSIKGTGVGGRIRKQDVLEAAEKAKAAKPAPAAAAAPSAPAPAKPAAKPEPSAKRGTTEKLPRIRSIIAKRLQQSLHETAQLTTVVEVDVTKVAKLRARAKDSFQAKHGVKLSFLPFFAVAAIEALQTYPIIQASMDLDGGTITYPGAEHLGIAVDTERGLLTPVIHNAGDLNMGGLAKRIADLAERTRANKITPDEMAGATFTLTNTGSRGALFDTPIVPSPQSAMLGTGAVVKRPVVVNDAELGEVVAIRSMVYLALSYDHRLIDGADAARFLTAVKERLEGGNFEAELGL